MRGNPPTIAATIRTRLLSASRPSSPGDSSLSPLSHSSRSSTRLPTLTYLTRPLTTREMGMLLSSVSSNRTNLAILTSIKAELRHPKVSTLNSNNRSALQTSWKAWRTRVPTLPMLSTRGLITWAPALTAHWDPATIKEWELPAE